MAYACIRELGKGMASRAAFGVTLSKATRCALFGWGFGENVSLGFETWVGGRLEEGGEGRGCGGWGDLRKASKPHFAARIRTGRPGGARCPNPARKKERFCGFFFVRRPSGEREAGEGSAGGGRLGGDVGHFNGIRLAANLRREPGNTFSADDGLNHYPERFHCVANITD